MVPALRNGERSACCLWQIGNEKARHEGRAFRKSQG
jgi:post-segregation antitoxin (ccd killing protein)